MLFSSTTFLFYFLPIVLVLYFATRGKIRNYVLLVGSLFFYSWGGVNYLPLLLISIVMNYFLGLGIEKYSENDRRKKGVLILGIILNIFFLGVFKYTNFFVDNINIIFDQTINIPIINLPIGISFYTFQAMSYVIDVYRKDGKVQRNIFDLALYISMFPQLVAGPIVRYQTVADQVVSREHSFEKFNLGMERFITGLFKKVVISNSVGELSTIIYGMGNDEMSVTLAWLGAIGYSLQIFFDFSGYSDMAIGLGKMFGFDFLENFNYPYISKSVSEFWRRWHISLGTWFKDYIYIPLGGNRVKGIKAYRNLFIVWFITGMWHGASWNFIIWGLYFGIFIMLEKLCLNKIFKRIPRIFSHIYLLIIVIVGWVIFSKTNMGEVVEYLKIMFGFGEYQIINGHAIFMIKEYALELTIGIILSMPIIGYLKKYKGLNKIIEKAKPVILISLFVITILYLINSTFNPFIYFNF
ncbi:MAG: MBOAT family O-acyltransferase [Clostridium sp.]